MVRIVNTEAAQDRTVEERADQTKEADTITRLTRKYPGGPPRLLKRKMMRPACSREEHLHRNGSRHRGGVSHSEDLCVVQQEDQLFPSHATGWLPHGPGADGYLCPCDQDD